MKIVSFQIGTVRAVDYRGKTYKTGIYKFPVEGPQYFSATGIRGDEVAEIPMHGGREKAVYGFSYDVYDIWRKERPQDPLEMGAFGENLTIDVLDESKVCVGDIFRVGEVLLRASEPRFPCFKLGIRLGDAKVITFFNQLSRPGVYFRVLQEGFAQAGDHLECIEKAKPRVSISEVFEFKNSRKPNAELAERALKVPALGESWRARFAKSLEANV